MVESMFSVSVSKELTRARKLLLEGKINETHEILTDFEKRGEITAEEQLSILLLKGRLYVMKWQFNKPIELGDAAYQIAQQLGNIPCISEALILKAYVVFRGKLDKCLRLISEIEKIIAPLTQESLPIYFQQGIKFSTLFLKFWVFYFKGEYDKLLDIAMQYSELAEKSDVKIYSIQSNYFLGWVYGVVKGDRNISLDYFMKSLEISRELSLKPWIAANLSRIGRVNWYKGYLDQALNSCKQSLLVKDVGDYIKVDTFDTLGNIYREKGDIERALKFYKQEASLAEELDYITPFARGMMNIGSVYRVKGNFDQAIDHFKQSMIFSEKVGYSYTSFYSLLLLILIYVDQNSLEEARQYLTHLKDLAEGMKSRFFNLGYMLAKAMVLKKQGRTRNLAEAESLLKQAVEEANRRYVDPQVHIMIIISFCEYLLDELITFEDPEILEEITPLIIQLLEISEAEHSYHVLAETKLLQAKLALIQMNIEEAKIFLIQAQRIAELHSLNLLAIKISSEHDRLLEQLSIWNSLKEQNASMPERIKLASIDGVLNRLQGKGAIDPPEIVDEQPTLLLILAEGGTLIFSLPFTEEWKRDETLFGSFLSAFKAFSSEFFAKGLDRAKFGDDLILIQSVGPFSICYLFKGQTYPATQRLTQFIEKIQKTTSIWHTLENFYQTSQVLDLKDSPSLKSLISEIFSGKNPVLENIK